MPNGNQMPGTPIGSSSSPPNNPATIEANVTRASTRILPLRAMRAPITTNSAIEPSRLPRVTLAEWITAPIVAATASTPADRSMLRNGGGHQRFQANAHAATAGTHITDASHAYVGSACRSVHATIALLRRL